MQVKRSSPPELHGIGHMLTEWFHSLQIEALYQMHVQNAEVPAKFSTLLQASLLLHHCDELTQRNDLQ